VYLGGVPPVEDGLGAEVGSVVVAEGAMVAEDVVLAVGEGGEGVAMWKFLLQTSTLTWTSTTRLKCKSARL
jgi:predicted RNA-binding protein